MQAVSCALKGQAMAFAISCEAKTFAFHPRGEYGTGLADTIWYGGDHFSLCHQVEGKRAVVRFQAPSDASYFGDLVQIEIRDDLPEPSPKETVASPTP